MAITVPRPNLTWSEKIYLPAIVAACSITLRHLKNMLLGQTKVTMQYPEEKWDSHLPEHYRGAPTLVKDEHGRERCVACQLCEFICPPRAIKIMPGRDSRWRQVRQGREIPGGIRHRHDPLHLLRPVRRSLPGAGDLPAQGLRHHRHSREPRWSTTKRSCIELGGVIARPRSESGTSRNEVIRLTNPCRPSSSGFFSALMLIFGAAVIINRNPVASALSLVVSFLGLAALFVDPRRLLHRRSSRCSSTPARSWCSSSSSSCCSICGRRSGARPTSSPSPAARPWPSFLSGSSIS